MLSLIHILGTQARILYQDAEGRMKIALRFNEMVRRGEVGPIMLGRDNHDVSGTDSPFRETSNLKDGSNVMADMAVQCFAGNCARGMSLVALHLSLIHIYIGELTEMIERGNPDCAAGIKSESNGNVRMDIMISQDVYKRQIL